MVFDTLGRMLNNRHPACSLSQTIEPGGGLMGNPMIISRRTTVTLVFVGLALLAAFASVYYFNRPVARVSLPPGTEFPACLLEDAPTCQESTKCAAASPGGLTYSKFHQKV